MREKYSKKLAGLVGLIALFSLAGVTFAGPRGLPDRYAPRSLDGQIEQVDVPGARSTVAAWAYRSGAQYDIAVSTSDAEGTWSEPEFFGRDDNGDQIEPVVAADRAGNVYLAYTDKGRESVMLTVRPSGRSDWSTPLPVAPFASGAETPSLLISGDNLIVAYQINRRIQFLELPLQIGQNSLMGLTDGSDPVGHDDDPPTEDDSLTDTAGIPAHDYSPIDKKIRPPVR